MTQWHVFLIAIISESQSLSMLKTIIVVIRFYQIILFQSNHTMTSKMFTKFCSLEMISSQTELKLQRHYIVLPKMFAFCCIRFPITKLWVHVTWDKRGLDDYCTEPNNLLTVWQLWGRQEITTREPSQSKPKLIELCVQALLARFK